MTQEHEIVEQISDALLKVEARIEKVLEEAGEARPVIEHLISSGGKRVRPLLTILSAGATGGEISDQMISIAAASELVHTASLLHDDVIDDSDSRRGRETAHLAFSKPVAVLAGDHCLASAVKLIHQADQGQVLAESLDMIRDLTNGELLQLSVQGRVDTSQQLYEDICFKKTAALFLWCSTSRARLAGASQQHIEALHTMARSAGIAFQIQDDLLDYVGEASIGKNLFDDLKERRLTMPLIVAMKYDHELKETIADLFSQKATLTEELALDIKAQIMETNAVQEVKQRLDDLTNRALSAILTLPQNEFSTQIYQRVKELAGRKD